MDEWEAHGGLLLLEMPHSQAVEYPEALGHAQRTSCTSYIPPELDPLDQIRRGQARCRCNTDLSE